MAYLPGLIYDSCAENVFTVSLWVAHPEFSNVEPEVVRSDLRQYAGIVGYAERTIDGSVSDKVSVVPEGIAASRGVVGLEGTVDAASREGLEKEGVLTPKQLSALFGNAYDQFVAEYDAKVGEPNSSV